MTDKTLSPRAEALTAILSTRASIPDPLISSEMWEKLVGLAWDHRGGSAARREVQREIKAVFLGSTTETGG